MLLHFSKAVSFSKVMLLHFSKAFSCSKEFSFSKEVHGTGSLMVLQPFGHCISKGLKDHAEVQVAVVFMATLDGIDFDAFSKALQADAVGVIKNAGGTQPLTPGCLAPWPMLLVGGVAASCHSVAMSMSTCFFLLPVPTNDRR